MPSIGAIIYRLRTSLREKRIKARFTESINTHKPIIVYQMGKVASMTIYNSLKEQYPGITLHRHELTASHWQDAALLKHANEDHKPLLLISMMRDPIARNISAFFQNFEVITGVKPQVSKFTNQQLSDIYFSNPKMDHTPPYAWFNENIKRHFGIDIYANPFLKQEGWARFKNGSVELLLMKAEINDDKKTQLIKEFTGLPNFQLKASNVSEDKDYAHLYASFKKEVHLPKDYLDRFYSYPEIKYFYTDEEIAAMRKKWER